MSYAKAELKAKHMAEKHGREQAMIICHRNYEQYQIADRGYWYWCEVYDHLLGADGP